MNTRFVLKRAEFSDNTYGDFTFVHNIHPLEEWDNGVRTKKNSTHSLYANQFRYFFSVNKNRVIT